MLTKSLAAAAVVCFGIGSAEAFEIVRVGQPDETCNVVSDYVHGVTAYMCLGNEGASNGDLRVVFMRESDAVRASIVVKNCSSEFLDPDENQRRTIKTGFLQMDFRKGEIRSSYLMEALMNDGQRRSWFSSAINTCDFAWAE